MKTSEQTLLQIGRMIRKITEKFPSSEEATIMTDIHIRVTQGTGEVTAFNDDDVEITRCVVEQWIDNNDNDFYEQIIPACKKGIDKNKKQIEEMALLRPFSFVLENEDRETISELYLVDDEMVIIDPDLMEGLDQDLNDFLEKLLKD